MNPKMIKRIKVINRQINWAAISGIAAALALFACGNAARDRLTPATPAPVPVVTAAQPGVPAACRTESAPVSRLCNDGGLLPWCATEDDATDGTDGPACFWRDPDTGDLWFNDGDGQRS